VLTPGERRWTDGPYVTEEYAIISGLAPEAAYNFRVSAHNKYGPGPFSWASIETRTLAAGMRKLVLFYLKPLIVCAHFNSTSTYKRGDDFLLDLSRNLILALCKWFLE